MRHWVPFLVSFALAMLTMGCEDEICSGGICQTEEECLEICVEFCDGEVLDAFCGFDEVCTCECEFSCLL